MPCVVQSWVSDLPYMQQSVLLTALRGPDGVHKNHISKLLIRWLRRSILLSAFDGGEVLQYPYDSGPPQGGSFTGPSLSHQPDNWQETMWTIVKDYMKTLDEVPHHFQLHFLHAAEILGYKHPEPDIRAWWNNCYGGLVNDMHLFTESESTMDHRLGDNEENWRTSEEVTAD